MRRNLSSVILAACLTALISPAEGAPPAVTPLRLRGYAVLPEPRHVKLESGSVRIDASWRVVTANVPGDDIAVLTLRQALRDQGLAGPAAKDEAGPVISLSVKSGAVATGREDEVQRQGYLLTVAPKRVEVVGNGREGLFYGVQTLVQLLAGDGRRRGVLPEVEIRDWPRYQLRICHWDTKHHQDRMETLKRFLDWMARFKLNAVSFELEDKFAYPSHPLIGAPGAFSPAQMRELVDYGLARHIQIIPNVQAPAHMCYVLKHPEFAAMRCDGSNYMACMDNPKVRRFIFDMYDDLCKATRGVKYFHVSTDEVYYAGICEKYRKPYNPVNRSLTFVDYVQAAHDFLAKRGRRIIIWAEFPLLAEHVHMLPADTIDGIIGGGDTFIDQENRRGIRQLAYASMQGAELLFPNYFPYAGRRGRRSRGRLADAYDRTLSGKATRGNPIGTFSAAWDDAGLHNETFWLGWAAMAQGGWTPGAASIEQTVAEFMDIFYGRGAEGMTEVYRGLQQQARFWESAWDRGPSKVRGKGYGYSGGKRPVGRTDLTLDPPPGLPKLPDLAFKPAFTPAHADLLAGVPKMRRQNDRLVAALQANLGKVERNRYNIEVFLSLAHLQRHLLDLLAAMERAEGALARAAGEHAAKRPAQAMDRLLAAHRLMAQQVRARRAVLEELTRTWEKSRLPRNVPVGGKKFFHVMDDVKDHFADRRTDLSYMTAPEESIGLEKWCGRLGEIMRSYAKDQSLPVAALPEPLMDD